MRTTAALALGCVILGAHISAQGLRHSDGDATATASLRTEGDSSATVGSATFKAGVDVVALTVVVTDPQRRLITGLGEQNFHVFEDGVQQDLSFFAASQVPLDLAL